MKNMRMKMNISYFRKLPPTFEEKLKRLEEGGDMGSFKSLKYDTRSAIEKK